MNRLSDAAQLHVTADFNWDLSTEPSELSPGETTIQAESGRCLADGREPELAWFCPLHYERNYAYPLLVWLHGPRDDESQLRRIMPQVSLRNFVGVAVRGTEPTPMASGRDARPTYGWQQGLAQVTLAEDRALGAIEKARSRFNIARRRIFLAGYDAGGTMALRLALRRPELFAGVVSLAGEFPVGQAPLARLMEARRVPLFLASGRDSQRYTATQVCRDLKLFHSAGLNVTLRQYPCGQELDVLMLADMNRWIMEQIGGGSADGV